VSRHQTHGSDSCQTLTDLKKNFTRRFSRKFAIAWLLKIPPCLAYVATLPCENIFCTRNCHVHKMSETIWHERLELLCKIQLCKNNCWKNTVWRCGHYLINWQKYFHCPYSTTRRMIDYLHLRHQHHRKLLLLTIIKVQSTFLPAVLPDVYQFKFFLLTHSTINL